MYDDIDVKKTYLHLEFKPQNTQKCLNKEHRKENCIDSTHSTNKYEFPQTTIMVPDEFNRTYPVGCLISNHADEMTLRLFQMK